MSFIWDQSWFEDAFAGVRGVEHAGIRRAYPCEVYQSAENTVYNYTRGNLEYSPELTAENQARGLLGLSFTDDEGRRFQVDENDFAALKQVNPDLFDMMMDKLPPEIQNKVNDLIKDADPMKYEYLKPCEQPALS